jgi:hypothetical protein
MDRGIDGVAQLVRFRIAERLRRVSQHDAQEDVLLAGL